MSSWLVTAIAGPAWQTLMIALMHTLWQGALLTAIVYGVLRALPARHHNARYLTALAGQFGLLLAGMATWAILSLGEPHAAGSSSREAVVPIGAAAPAAFAEAAPRVSGETHGRDSAPVRMLEGESLQAPSVARWLPFVVVGYLAGVAAMLLRLISIVTGAGNLAQPARPSEPELIALVDQLRDLLAIGRKIRVVVTSQVGPAVLGVLCPVLLLPEEFLMTVHRDALRAIVIHELAHVRRHDYLLNLIGMLVEAVLFFNPAVWWLGRQVRQEREACCDALAVALTGKRLIYSRALAEWAAESRGVAPAAAPAFAGPSRGRSLLDRVRRILQPGYRPDVRLSPLTLTTFLALSFLGLAALWEGTSAAVSLAAQILSPAERIERLAATQQQFSGAAQSAAGTVTLRGTVLTADGEAIPENARAYYMTRRNSGTFSGSTGQLKGPFTLQTPSGSTWLIFNVEGYAAAVAGPFEGQPGKVIEGVKVTLDRGFPADVRIVDEQGHPVAGATVECGVLVSGGSTGSSEHTKDTSDAQGIARLKHVASRAYRLSVHAAGFQSPQTREVTFQPGQAITVALKRAKIVNGIVRSSAGQPIAGAKILEASHFTPSLNHYGSRQGPVLATTDSAGRFTLDTLNDATTYSLLIETTEHGRTVVANVQPGQADRTITVGPDRVLHGRVLGALGTLNPERPLVVAYTQSVSADGREVFHDSGNVPVEREDGVGHFTIRGLLEGPLRLEIAGRLLEIENFDRPVEIDLSKPPEQPLQRRVVLKFVTPDGTASPQGTVWVYAYDPAGNRPSGVVSKHLTIAGGRVEIEVPTPARLQCQTENVIGYWLDVEPQEVPPGATPLEIEIPALPAGAIAGRVVRHDGTPADERARISCRMVKKPASLGEKHLSLNTLPQREAGTAGQFFLSPLPLGGTYSVFVTEGHNAQVSEPVAVDGTKPVAQLTVKMAKQALAQGVVKDEEGRALGTINVTPQLRASDIQHSWSAATTDAAGRFAFEVNPELGTFWARFETRKDYVPTEVKLSPGGPSAQVRLKRGRVIGGRVVDAKTGWPIPGVELYARSQNQDPLPPRFYEAEGKTDDAGRFRFSNLEDGTYTLGDRNGLKRQESENVQEIATGQDRVELRATLPAWSTIQLRNPAVP